MGVGERGDKGTRRGETRRQGDKERGDGERVRSKEYRV